MKKDILATIPELNQLFIIGLMGGIASGKSTVAKVLGELGAYVIDADDLVHNALEDPNIQYKIVQLWGNHLVVSGHVNKKELARIVFPRDGDESQEDSNLQKLESILHPIVTRGIEESLKKLAITGRQDVVLDIALLWESGLYKLCDVLIFVDAPLSVRQERAHKNRNWAMDEVPIREKFQEDTKKKKEKADFVIPNKGNLEETTQYLKEIWKNLLIWHSLSKESK